MKRTLLFTAILTIYLSGLFGSSLQAEVVNKVVAIVNEEVITLYDLDRAMAQTKNIEQIMEMGSRGEKAQALKTTRNQALKVLVEDKLLDQEMERRNIAISKEDEEKAINNVLERNKMTLEQLKNEIRSKGGTWTAYRASLMEQLKRIKFMGQVLAPRVRVTDADLDEFFARNQKQFSRFQSVEMAQVIIPVAPDAGDAELGKAQKIAAEVAKKAQAGEDMEELGKKYSNFPATALKETYPVAQLAPQIVAVVSELSPGEVSEPVRSSMGLHVIKLYDRKTLAGEEYKAIREQIRAKVFELKLEEELENYLDDLKKKSFIEIKV